jgi:hypothetical protein
MRLFQTRATLQARFMLLDIFNPSEIIDFVTFQGHAQVGAPRWKGFTGLAYHQLRLASKAKVYSVT